MGATLPERRHELAVPYLSERPYQSDLTRSLAISSFWSAKIDPERPPRATTRSRSSSRARSPQRHPEVARLGKGKGERAGAPIRLSIGNLIAPSFHMMITSPNPRTSFTDENHIKVRKKSFSTHYRFTARQTMHISSKEVKITKVGFCVHDFPTEKMLKNNILNKKINNSFEIGIQYKPHIKSTNITLLVKKDNWYVVGCTNKKLTNTRYQSPFIRRMFNWPVNIDLYNHF
ncbi:hypothetical protein YC2023_052338 [Brassica napus]